jgi:hypothetical protein
MDHGKAHLQLDDEYTLEVWKVGANIRVFKKYF